MSSETKISPQSPTIYTSFNGFWRCFNRQRSTFFFFLGGQLQLHRRCSPTAFNLVQSATNQSDMIRADKARSPPRCCCCCCCSWSGAGFDYELKIKLIHCRNLQFIFSLVYDLFCRFPCSNIPDVSGDVLQVYLHCITFQLAILSVFFLLLMNTSFFHLVCISWHRVASSSTSTVDSLSPLL